MTATTPAADLAIPATVAAINAATDREQVRQLLTDWRAQNWDAWATAEATGHASDAAKAAEVGDHHLLEQDGSWRVDYLPRDLDRAWVRALTRLPDAPAPAVYYRARD